MIAQELVRELERRGFALWEGSASEAEQEFLARVMLGHKARLVGEIGFNAGISSWAMLAADPAVEVVSFDQGDHYYVRAAKELVDRKFPGRHRLVAGDSRETVPQYAREHRRQKFDMVFVDGGHEYSVVKADLSYMRRLAGPETAVVIDDLTPWLPWGAGPTQAWTEEVAAGRVRQVELWRDGRRVEAIEPPGERSWALGYYVFK